MCVFIPLVPVPDRVGEPAERVPRPRQEMPSRGGRETAVIFHICLFFRSRQSLLFVGIETDGEYIEFVSDCEVERTKTLNQAVQGQRRKHWAFEVDHR